MRLSALWREARFREHAGLSALFVVGRGAVDLAGLRFNFILDWMFLSDPEDLRTQLLTTVYYSHASPPGMNLLTGLLLKLAPAHAATLAHGVLALSGLVLANALLFLLRIFDLRFVVALAVATGFSLIPQSLYLEHLYIYTVPTAALLTLSAVLFHRGVARGSWASWFAFFLCCAVIACLRSTFHLLWFIAMIGLALGFAARRGRMRVLTAAAGPGALLLALYLKNLAVFGVFGATSYGPVNLTQVTVRRLPAAQRADWISDGRLSPYAAIDVFSGPEAYRSLLGAPDNPEWPALLDRLDRPSVGKPNFNHWYFLKVNPQRRRDGLRYLTALPGAYARSVLVNLVAFFSPSTRWHPWDRTERSPHLQHRQTLGAYEAAYDAAVHRFPVAPVGLYLFLPVPLWWAVRRARDLSRAVTIDQHARGALLWFCLFQIAYVTAASVLLTYGENARYRYMIEAMIWLVTAQAIAHLPIFSRRPRA
jgi:hypothetical protein